MTKKDYILLARVIRRTLHSIRASGAYYRFIDVLCDELLRDNSKFNSETFRRACDYER